MYNMKLFDFANIIRSESSAIEFLCKQSRMMDRNIACPSCKSKRYYIMRKGYARCKRCMADYDPFVNAQFGKVRINYDKWLSLIKLFDLGISARRASKETGTSYPAALKAFDAIRYSIVHELAKKDKILKGEIEADESYFGGKRKGMRGRGAKNKTIVFGIMERNGKVSISIVKDVSAESLINETVKKVRRGSIVYTDKWKSYDSLMFCGYKHLSIDHKYKFKRGKVYINGIEGFWSFAKERLAKHHGISPGKFLFYIKEQEWRYNHREKDLFMLLVKYMLGDAN